MTRRINNISEYIRNKINNHTALDITVKSFHYDSIRF